jgi:hypothetical protein
MPEYLAERYEPGIAAHKLRDDARRLAQVVTAMREEGESIELLGLTYLPSDEGAFSRFRSPSEALVAEAHKRGGVPFERIVEVLPVEIDEGGAQ